MEYITIAADLVKNFFNQWDSIETVAVRIIDFFENIIMTFAAK